MNHQEWVSLGELRRETTSWATSSWWRERLADPAWPVRHVLLSPKKRIVHRPSWEAWLANKMREAGVVQGGKRG
jgi:hypothetical protein